LIEDFAYYQRSKKPELFLVIIQSARKEEINGLEKIINDLTQNYDELRTDTEPGFTFWELFPHIPPPKKENKNEIQ